VTQFICSANDLMVLIGFIKGIT